MENEFTIKGETIGEICMELETYRDKKIREHKLALAKIHDDWVLDRIKNSMLGKLFMWWENR